MPSKKPVIRPVTWELAAVLSDGWPDVFCSGFQFTVAHRLTEHFGDRITPKQPPADAEPLSHEKVMFMAAAEYRDLPGETRVIIEVPYAGWQLSGMRGDRTRFATNLGAPAGAPGEYITVRSRDEEEFLGRIAEATAQYTTIKMED